MTSTERRRTWSERLDPRNWSLVAKLAIVGLVPTVLALAIGAVRVVDQANVAEELGQGSGLVDAHQQVGALTQALQAERSAAVVFVGGNRLGDRNAVDSAQAATDQALQRVNATLTTAEQQAPQIATARRQADTTLGQLPVIRSQVANPPTPAIDVTTRYTSVVQRALSLDRALIAQLQTSDTAGLASALGSTSSATEALELERTVLGGAIAASQLTEQQRALVNGAEASYQAAASDFQAALTPQQVNQLGNFAAGPANDARQTLRDQIMATPDEGRVTADPAAWNAAVDASTAVVRSADDQAEQQFVDGRAQAAEEAGNTAGLNSVLLMLGILLTVGIILLLGRQLVRSLRILRTSALDVAERKLPQAVQGMRAGQAPSALVEPVPLESRDEIGQVARAFDAVHGQAIRLAADQAALQQNVNSMFVNLSRRSQALVERQLQLIEQLESNEQDPDQLSNLFQLDHLATRMRRNSENLLVLAGTDLAKRNVAPVQVVDVLRAAVSEVEQYQRVVVQTPPTATIAGRAANDVVHLLAELLDNATNFSPPDSQVVMSTTRTADESLLVEISDRGVGMADSELSDANQRLSGPSEVDVSASRRMGLFVVGRLAARHRIGVRLSSASGAGRTGGLSASVTVPPQLVPSSTPVLEQPPAMVGAGDPGTGPRSAVAPAPPMPALERPEFPDPVVRNGSASAGSSTITGADGPVAPTFGSGSTGGPSRNGSAAKLPTRTPGSALRQNPADTNGSTNGAGAAPNGTPVNGITAFTPYGPGSDGGPATNGSTGDVFAPDPDAPSSSGAYRPVPGTNGAAPPRDPRDPGAGRPAAGSGPEQPESAYDDGPETTGSTDEHTGTTESPHEGSGGNGRTMFGVAAAGVGGVLAGAFSRRGESDDTGHGDTGRDTVDRDLSGHDDTQDTAGHTSDDTVRADSGDGDVDLEHDEPIAPAADTDTGRGGVADDHTAEAGDDAGAVVGEAGSADPSRTGDRIDPEFADGFDDGFDDGSAQEQDADLRYGEGAEHADGHRDGGGDDTDDTDDAARGHEDADDVAPVAGPTATEPEDEPDTTAFPVVRPQRERMGIPRSGPGPVRPGPPRPAPARRPVMPGTSAGPRPDDVRPTGPGPAPVGPGADARSAGAALGADARSAGAALGAAPGRSTRADQEELFAPAVAVEGDRGQLRRPGGLETARSGSGYDISQTTPIFEEIASAWFRSNRSVPVRWEDGGPDRNAPMAGTAPGATGTRPPQPGHPAPNPGAAPRPAPAPRPSTGATPLGTGAGAPVSAGASPSDGRPAGEDPGFASPADDVWRQAAAGSGDAEQQPDEVTSAGLPKRRPRARLLPGSAAGSTVLTQPSSEPRNADTVRGRLASYQQGVRQGRESASARTAHTGEDTPDPSTGDRRNTSDHEENT